jgi:hypothetical protein
MKLIIKKCSVIGCGRMFQIHHNKNLLKCNYIIENLFDPREKLLAKISNNFNIKKSYSDFDKFLKNDQSKIIFFFLPRDVSYFFLKKLLKKKNITVFIEKPPVLYKENFLKIIKLLEKNNNKLFIGYMLRYSHAVKILKKRLTNIKINNIKNVFCEMSLNYDLKKNKYITFDEKINKKYIENKSNNNITNIAKYKIFLNRYSHIINLLYYFFNKLKIEKIICINFFNYKIFLKGYKTKILIKLNDNLKYIVKLDFCFHKEYNIALNFIFNNKTFDTLYSEKKGGKIKEIQLKDDLYFNEINEFFTKDKKLHNHQIKNYHETLKFCEKI